MNPPRRLIESTIRPGYFSTDDKYKYDIIGREAYLKTYYRKREQQAAVNGEYDELRLLDYNYSTRCPLPTIYVDPVNSGTAIRFGPIDPWFFEKVLLIYFQIYLNRGIDSKQMLLWILIVNDTVKNGEGKIRDLHSFVKG